MTRTTTAPVTMAEWAGRHPDFRYIRKDGTPVWLRLDEETGATTSVAVPIATPWGRAEIVREIADGIVSVSTPSHGGIWLSHSRLKAMPYPLRVIKRWETPDSPWFEEDCSSARVICSFPEHFDDRAVHHALLALEGFYPAALDALKDMGAEGTYLACLRDRESFLTAHAESWERVSSGTWKDGWIVCLRRVGDGATARRFLTDREHTECHGLLEELPGVDAPYEHV